jgi:hypothetical protein
MVLFIKHAACCAHDALLNAQNTANNTAVGTCYTTVPVVDPSFILQEKLQSQLMLLRGVLRANDALQAAAPGSKRSSSGIGGGAAKGSSGGSKPGEGAAAAAAAAAGEKPSS